MYGDPVSPRFLVPATLSVNHGRQFISERNIAKESSVNEYCNIELLLSFVLLPGSDEDGILARVLAKRTHVRTSEECGFL